MPAVYQAIGTQSAGTASVAVAWPAHAIDDLGIMVIETGGEGTTLAVPSGWTAVTGSPVTAVATTAGSKLQVWYKFATSAAEANVNTGDSGDHQVARIITFRGVNKTTPFDATPVAATKTTASTTVTWDTITTATANALIVLIATRPDDSTSVAAFSNPVNANLTTLTEHGEAGTNAGHGGGFVIVTGTKATAGAVGTTTMTGPNTTNAELIIALREAPAAQTLTPARFDNTNTFHNPTVVAGAVDLAVDRYDNAQTFYSADVTQTGGAIDLAPARYDNAQTFYAATVTATRTLTAARYDNAQTYFGPTLTSSITLAPDLYANSNAFYAPALSLNATLTVSPVENTSVFYSPVVTTGALVVAPSRFDNTQTFYSATVTPGAVTLSASRLENTQTFYSQVVASGASVLQPGRLDNEQAFFAASLTASVGLSAARYDNTQDFYGPAVTTATTLTAARLDNTTAFYAPTVSDGDTQQITFPDWVGPGWVEPGWVGPPYFNTAQFFPATVAAAQPVASISNAGTGRPFQFVPFAPVPARRPRKRRDAELLLMAA